ncbi:MAG: hypothetical protein JXA28_01460 [Bacteroidetes bacterium]|nr:hypothetical protein [Bacteroidota bacterium]
MYAASLSRLTAALTFLILLSSCDSIRFWERPESIPETAYSEGEILDVRKKATLIQSSIGTMDRRDLPLFSVGDSMLEVTLYNDAGRLRLVDERISNRNGSYSRNRYYYDSDALFFFYAKSRICVNPGGHPAEYAEGLTRMYFNSKGNMFHYEKTINGLSTEMMDGELPAIMRRAFALRELEWNDSTGVVDTTAFLAVIYTVDAFAGNAAGFENDSVEEMPAEETPDTQEMTADNGEKGTAADVTPGQTAGRRELMHSASEEKTDGTAKTSQTAQGRPSSADRKHITQERTSPPSPVPSAQQPPAPSPPPAVVPADEILIEPHTHAMLPGTLSSHRIRFQKGSSGATLSASVRKGHHKEYVLRARQGQRMSVTLQTTHPDVHFRVFLNDGDISGQRRSWSGSLPRSEDYHIVVYVRQDSRSTDEAVYTITMGIQ